MTDEELMRRAIAAARDGIENGQTPFGACIARDGQVVVAAHNNVWAGTDITAHAEIVAIRAACRKLGSVDLSGCAIYSTAEPCPMCFSACHWAKLERIVFGARIADAQAAGFGELTISNEQMKALGRSGVAIAGDFLRDECVALFALWSARPDKRAY
jgi:guanine deaminase